MGKIKKFWNKLKYWQKGLFVAVLIYLLLDIAYLVFSLINYNEILCPTFGGSVPCGVIGYIIISVGGLPWYFIFVGLPLIIIFSIFGYFKSKK